VGVDAENFSGEDCWQDKGKRITTPPWLILPYLYIKVYGTNRKEWEGAIAEIVDVAQLKVELREGKQISQEELNKLKEAQGISDEDISSLIIK
jgi:hypothetical protein